MSIELKTKKYIEWVQNKKLFDEKVGKMRENENRSVEMRQSENQRCHFKAVFSSTETLTSRILHQMLHSMGNYVNLKWTEAFDVLKSKSNIS